jgi:hypothetical protein
MSQVRQMPRVTRAATTPFSFLWLVATLHILYGTHVDCLPNILVLMADGEVLRNLRKPPPFPGLLRWEHSLPCMWKADKAPPLAKHEVTQRGRNPVTRSQWESGAKAILKCPGPSWPGS